MRYNIPHWKEKVINGTEHRLEGKIYVENNMTSFQEEFPNVFFHSTLATEEELSTIKPYQNRLAALGYNLALESDVFTRKQFKVTEDLKGLEKRLTPIGFFRQRFVKLIDRPDAGLMSWEHFSSEVRRIHRKD